MECIFVGDHITCFSFSMSFPGFFFLKKFKFPCDFDKIVFSILQNSNRLLSSRKQTSNHGRGLMINIFYNFAQRDAGYCMTTSQDRLHTFKWLQIILYKQFYQCEGCHKILKSVPY